VRRPLTYDRLSLRSTGHERRHGVGSDQDEGWESGSPHAEVDSAGHRRPDASHSLGVTRALQITASAAPRSSTSATSPTPSPGDGQQLYEVSSSGVNLADTHHTSS
jgi:NADPH2:quinone reductase